MIGFVVKVKAKNRSRDGRLFRIQRNEWTEGFQGGFNRKWRILSGNITNSSNWIFTDKLSIRESVFVQVPDSDFPALRTGHNAKTLLYRRRWGVSPITSVPVPGKVRQIEDLPITQRAVAAKIELPRADAANGHADTGQLFALIDFALTFGEETFNPGLRKILVLRYMMGSKFVPGRKTAIVH